VSCQFVLLRPSISTLAQTGTMLTDLSRMNAGLNRLESIPSQPLTHIAIRSVDRHINRHEAGVGAHEISLVGIEREKVIAGSIPSVTSGGDGNKAAVHEVAGDFIQTRCSTTNVGLRHHDGQTITNLKDPLKPHVVIEDAIGVHPALQILHGRGLAHHQLHLWASTLIGAVVKVWRTAIGLRVGGFEPAPNPLIKEHPVLLAIRRRGGDQTTAGSKETSLSCPASELIFFKLEARKPATLFISKACAIASSELRIDWFERIWPSLIHSSLSLGFEASSSSVLIKLSFMQPVCPPNHCKASEGCSHCVGNNAVLAISGISGALAAWLSHRTFRRHHSLGGGDASTPHPTKQNPPHLKVDKSVYKKVNPLMPATVRISDAGRSMLGDLATKTHASMTEVLDAALDLYRRHRFLSEANEAYARLAADPAATASYRADLDSLEGTLADGLADQHS
jgi:hypothetical protein